MKIGKRARLIVLVALGVLLVCRSVTVGAPIEGRVVDAVTREPLKDVVVIVAWKRKYAHVAGANPAGLIYLAETKTNAAGEYRFSGFIRMHWPLFPFSSLIRDWWEFPAIYLFRPGYQPNYVSNGYPAPARDRNGFVLLFTSAWDGWDINLKPAGAEFESGAEDRSYLQRLKTFQDGIKRLMRGRKYELTCHWDRVSDMLLALRAAGYTLGSRELQLDEERPQIEACGQGALFGWD